MIPADIWQFEICIKILVRKLSKQTFDSATVSDQKVDLVWKYIR